MSFGINDEVFHERGYRRWSVYADVIVDVKSCIEELFHRAFNCCWPCF